MCLRWQRAYAVSVWAVFASVTVACGPPVSPVGLVHDVHDVPDVVAATSARPAATVSRSRLVVLGDSLTAGLGVSPEEAYPAVLQARLDKAGYDVEVLNAGVSGDTTAGGLRRLDWSMDGQIAMLIVALGGNDGLRGLPVAEIKRNLKKIIETATERDVSVLLAGMEAPPNFGPTYTRNFRQVFQELAKEHDVVFVPFLLEGVAGVPELNQPDQIHPNAEGAARVADHLFPAVESLAQRALAVR